MNAKEKADFLVAKMIGQTWNYSSHHLNTLSAKQCAIVAVEEMIEYLLTFSSLDKLQHSYWIEVKKEIEKL